MRRLIQAAVLIAIGLAGGAAMAVPFTRSTLVERDIATGNGTLVGIWNSAKTLACGDVDSAMGFGGGTCAGAVVETGSVITITKGPVNDHVTVELKYGGTWTRP